MYKLITITMLCAVLFSTQAQITFEKTYGGTGGDFPFSVQQTADGGYVIVGETNSFGEGGFDVYLIKTDALGDTLWTKVYGGISDEQGYSVQQTADGGYVIAGYTKSFGAGSQDVYLIKTDATGDTMWTKAYGGVLFYEENSVKQTSDGGYIIVGSMGDFTIANEVYLIKIDVSGDTMWTKAYGGSSTDGGRSVQQTADGGYVIAGYTRSFGAGSSCVYVIKTDATGDTMWTKAYGGTSYDEGYSVQQTADGGYVITGFTESFGAGDYDVYLIKTDNLGDTMWTKTYGGSGADYGNSVQQTTDGGYVITGFTNSFGAGSADVYFIKTDALGDTIWTKTYGGSGFDLGYSVQQTADGGYVIAGSRSGDFYLIKTDANGNTYGCSYSGTFTVVGNTATQVSSGSSVSSAGNVSTTTSTIVNYTSTGIYNVNVPTISLSLSNTNTKCDGICDGTAIVNATGTYPPFWYQWNDSLLQTGDSAFGLCARTYTVTVTDAYACTTATDSITIINIAFPQDFICLITVDSTSTKNVIVWEKPVTQGIDSFKIYREITTDNYQHVGSVAYSDLSVYTDTSAGINPNTTSYRYKLSILDTCGNENVLSDFHKTIHLTIFTDVNNDPVLSWTDYGGFIVSQYKIMRDDLGTGNWQPIDSVPFGVTIYTNQNPPSDSSIFRIEAVHPSGGCIATLAGQAAKTKTYNQSKSNYANKLGTTGISNPQSFENLAGLTIYPNPYTGKTQITYYLPEKSNATLEVYNLLGKKLHTLADGVQSQGKYSYEFSAKELGYGEGIYLVKLSTSGKVFTKLLVEIK